MAGKKSAAVPKPIEEEAKKMDVRRAALKEDYVDLQKEVKGLRQRVKRARQKKQRLEAEIRYLRRRHKELISKNYDESKDSMECARGPIKFMCTNKMNIPSVGGKAIEKELKTHQPADLQSTKSPEDCSPPERTELGPSPNWIRPNSLVHHTSSTKPIVKSAPKRRQREKNGKASTGVDNKVNKKRKTKGCQQKPLSPSVEANNSGFWDSD